jgi:hypothetical protein
MKSSVVCIVAAALLAGLGFAQTFNASLGGTVYELKRDGGSKGDRDGNRNCSLRLSF